MTMPLRAAVAARTAAQVPATASGLCNHGGQRRSGYAARNRCTGGIGDVSCAGLIQKPLP